MKTLQDVLREKVATLKALTKASDDIQRFFNNGGTGTAEEMRLYNILFDTLLDASRNFDKASGKVESLLGF